jgi:signal transduction histidine kinase
MRLHRAKSVPTGPCRQGECHVMRVWGRRSEVPAAIGVARAFNEGLSRQKLLRQTSSALSRDGRADRVGVWLESAETEDFDHGPIPSFRGVVWDRESENVPAEWRRLSPQVSLPQDLLTAGRSVELDQDALPIIGPLIELRRALWVPIGRKGRLVGVLLAGSRSRHGELPRELFESAAAELALAIDLEEEQRVSGERQADLCMVRQALVGFGGTRPADELLADLVDGCTAGVAGGHGLGATFAVIGCATEGAEDSGVAQKVQFHWKSGDSFWTREIESPPAAEIWRKAMETRRLTGDVPDARFTRDRVSRIVAIPLEAEGKLLGILVAGLSPATASPAVVERLELRAALAATALEGWRRSKEEARQTAWRNSILDSGTHATVLLDEEGRIAGLSAGAKTLLSEQTGRENAEAQSGSGGQRLMQLFQAGDQARIEAWSQRALSKGGERRSERRNGPAELPEAMLSNGVRVRLRPALPIGGPYVAVVLENWRELEWVPRDSHAESELSSVLEWLDDGVILFDAQDNVRALNSRFLQLTGLNASDARNLVTLESLILKLSEQVDGPWSFAQRWRNLARGIDGGVREELEFVRPSARTVQRMARPILDGTGRRLGRVEIYRDLSARRGLQSKLLRTERLAALGQLVTAIAHELNNPLTSILGYSQHLLEKEDKVINGQEVREIRQIFEAAERATGILRQLLLNAHESKPEIRTVAINQVVLQGIELQRQSLAQENICVEMDLDQSNPLVYSDAGQLQQVFLNLTGNARQALDQTGKGGTIRIRTKQIGEQRVLLEIADDGPGIPQEIIERIFDPFFTTKAPGIGTGLGLAIVSGIVQEHGGHVNVASPRSGGAIFSIALLAAGVASKNNFAAPPGNEMLRGYLGGIPSSYAASDNAARGHQNLEMRKSSRRGSKRILVVEDEPTVARLIADVLEDEGFRVDVLLDGHEALKQAGRESYDLVICDMKMPGLDGQHFYKALLQADNSLSERFVFVTGDVVAPHTHQFLEINRVPHVAKPFRVEELKDKVHGVLDRTLPRAPRLTGARKNA